MSTTALPTSALKRSRCYWETWSNVKGQRAPTRNNQRQKYMCTPFAGVYLIFAYIDKVFCRKMYDFFFGGGGDGGGGGE